MTRPLALILCTVMLDAIGISLIFPVLPDLLRTMTGKSEVAQLFGMMLALYGLMQFFFSPVLGVLSDRYGRRPVLLLSLTGSVIDYLVMVFTPYLWLLFLSRAIAGMTGANIVVATAYIADITPESERVRRFGLFHAAVGIGFVAGLVTGGVLGDIWLREPFLAAGILNAINLAIAIFFLPESHKPVRDPIRWQSLNPFVPLRWAFEFRRLLPLLGVCVLLNLAGQSYGTVWVLFTGDRFGWTATDVGLSLALFGALAALVQAIAAGPVTARIGERGALLLGIACEVAALIVISLAMSPWIALATIPLVALGRIGLPVLQSMLANAVDSQHQGRLQGVVVGLVSLTAVVGPVIFSNVYALTRTEGSGMVWIVCAVIYAMAVPFVLWIPKRTVHSQG